MCGGGQLCAAASCFKDAKPTLCPVLLDTACIDLEMGEAAVVPSVTELKAPIIDIMPNPVATVRAFNSIWKEVGAGYVLVLKAHQPHVHLERGDIVATAWDSGSRALADVAGGPSDAAPASCEPP